MRWDVLAVVKIGEIEGPTSKVYALQKAQQQFGSDVIRVQASSSAAASRDDLARRTRRTEEE